MSPGPAAAACPTCGRELLAYRQLRQESRVLADGTFSYPFSEGEAVAVRCATGHHLLEAASVPEAERLTAQRLALGRP